MWWILILAHHIHQRRNGCRWQSFGICREKINVSRMIFCLMNKLVKVLKSYFVLKNVFYFSLVRTFIVHLLKKRAYCLYLKRCITHVHVLYWRRDISSLYLQNFMYMCLIKRTSVFSVRMIYPVICPLIWSTASVFMETGKHLEWEFLIVFGETKTNLLVLAIAQL